MPSEFKSHPWDYNRFDLGERFFYQPLPRAEFDEIVQQVERRGLDDFMAEKAFDSLALPVHA